MRIGSSWASCVWLGGPVFSPSAGTARTRTTKPIASATGAGRRSAAATRAISLERPSPGAGPIRQRSTFGPSSVSTAGPATVATSTLSATTSTSVAASEPSSEPGTMKKATSIESISVLPAKTVVRPALRRVAAAASTGVAPAASSSRKRETISSA